MENINQSIAHIDCPYCNRTWQVLNEDGTDWDEEKTTTEYHNHLDTCNVCTLIE